MSAVDELCRAIEANDARQARQLLAIQANLADSGDGTPPPIHWAIYCDKRQMVELLLDHGANIERRDQDRDATPLDYAIVYARTEIIPVLIARGASLEGKLQLALKGAAGGFEEFSELPSRHEYQQIAELLRELGAQP